MRAEERRSERDVIAPISDQTAAAEHDEQRAPDRDPVAPMPRRPSPLDVQAVRLLLEGGSVVDWRGLHVTSREEAQRVLAVNGFDLDNPKHLQRLLSLRDRALSYVDETFDTDIPSSVRTDTDPIELILMAAKGQGWQRRAACVLLKVMHVLNHVDARRLAYHLSISESALFEAARSRVDRAIESLGDSAIDLVAYVPSTKTEHSVVHKLISKPRVTAAQIFDKLRCRIIISHRQQLVPTVVWLTRHLFPFNHIIPGESHNTILSEAEIHGALEGRLQTPTGGNEATPIPHRHNPATSSAYRMTNFVVDLPVCVDTLVDRSGYADFHHLGHLVYVTLEFQLFDQTTFEENDRGEARHDAYKARQLAVVGQRLWGRDLPPLHATK